MRFRWVSTCLMVSALSAQTEKSREFDHLEPLRWVGGGSTDYYRRVDDLLGFDPGEVATLTRPSFSSESLVRLEVVNRREVEAGRSEPRYEVHHAIANANVWYAIHGWWSDEATAPASFRELQAEYDRVLKAWDENGRKTRKPKQANGPSLLEHIRVEKRSAPFPTPLAHRITAVWRRMLLDVRDPEGHRAGLDGTTHVFAAERRVGGAWSPNKGTTPALMVEVSESLAAYVLSKNDERAAALRTVEARVLALEQRLDEVKSAPSEKSK